MPLESSVLSENNIRKIRSWVETCSENHIGCLTGRDANFFPARLLQIGNPDTNYDLRLIESSGTSFMSTLDKSAPPKYMALSYCWPTPDDTHKLLTTTQETLPGLMLDITSDSLPKAFRDAVRLAQALDIQYVWIDSLCIIQADEQDWQTESSKMAEIFSNAYLTVIAAAGVSCHVGFLERDATRPWCSVPIPDSNSTFAGGSFCLRYRRHRGSEKMAQIKHGRWITRSWTYQEERLARRVLMFGENKFFFDCRTMERIEGTDRCKPRPDWVDTIREKTGDNDFDPPIRTNTGQIYKRRTPYNHWQTLCSHYSRRVLTYADDKLPAISGMAKHIAKKVDSDYLAGLWREHLLQDLLWHTIDGGKRPDNFRTSHYQYRAPTWSWASKDGHLSWPDMRFFSSSESTAYCEILDAQTDLAGLDPYGAVVGGHIKVSGRVIEVEIGLGDVTPKPWVIQSGGLTTATIRPDITGVESGIRVGKKYHALLIANWQIQEAKLPIPRGLLLEKTDGSRSDGLDEFERVGIFIVYSDIATGHPSPLSAWTSSGARTIAIL
ncbi:heterokaryon incompatibility protein-domain-containing protein [Amylocarpus encephaloides]|uniref:Heterokaryon incompatibility protein-domain-containing protein n=1 Tax=Amylocarpus encephaloides TaxID=45428 RepID=A0A9P8C3Z5_9HELO|nr:heterokaryon incompatibility protein-domain-containing protein [Amylocarpus encephaloides]